MMRLLTLMPTLAMSFAFPAVAQQISAQDAQHVAQSITDAANKASQQKDAAGLAALFTDDAVFVTPQGIIYGRADIEKHKAEALGPAYTPEPGKIEQAMPIGNAVLLAGTWSGTYHASSGPVHLTGYWSAAIVRDGDAWKIRQETYNSTPPPPEANK
ncbi:MAG: nuclear transport factor 2 family protein [Acetobacteraceae bacterium]|nr:nuclear transport factor 2 family protein [Acetobacteraceae bacterium]